MRLPRIKWFREDLGGPDKRLWEENWGAVGWARKSPNMKYFAEFPYCLKYIAPGEGPVLDAGCGPAHYVKAMREKGINVVGMDYSFDTLRSVNEGGASLPLHVGDVRFLPYRSGVFSAVLHFGVAEHFEDGPETCIREAARVLKPGGLLILSVPFMNIFRKLSYPYYAVAGNRAKLNHKFYQYIFTRKEIMEILNKEGFRSIESERIYYTTIINNCKILNSLRNIIMSELKKLPSDAQKMDSSNVADNGNISVSDWKSTVKKGLNLLFAHFIVVVARKA